MKKYMINLNSIDKVKNFVNTLSDLDGYFDIAVGRYVVDAKSIMGILSMDLSKNIEFRILETSESEDKLERLLAPYICK